MRLLGCIFFTSLLVLAAGCAPYQNSSSPAADASAAGSIVDSRDTAITVGRNLLKEQQGATWIDGPRAVYAREMSYEKANELIGVDDGQFDVWPGETRVWLAIFEGRWQLVPQDPSQTDPMPLTYDGCVLVLFTARVSELIAMGDSVCPPY